MAIAHLTIEDIARLREHGHADYWEIAIYPVDADDPDSVTVECTKCGEVLIELLHASREDSETPRDEARYCELLERVRARFQPEDLDDHVHELVSQEASNINNQGIESQFEYLFDNAGADWLEQLLTEDKGE